MITRIKGVRVGHWSDPVARTGCTVVLLPAGTVASGEVRGGAPGTREWALLEPGRTVAEVQSVVLTGGSAFGLAACEGVMRWCEERGLGFPAPAGPVPIVVGMVLYDLGVGDSSVRPGAAQGYVACESASTAPVQSGPIGAGTGATVGKWNNPAAPQAGGLGSAIERDGDLLVAALMAVNAAGHLRPDHSRPGRGDPLARDDESAAGEGAAGEGAAGEGAAGESAAGEEHAATGDGGAGGNGGIEATTIGIVVTNAALSKLECHLVAESSHDGLARAIDPVHTAADGDALVAAATGEVPARVDLVRLLATRVVEAAVRDAVAAGARSAFTRSGQETVNYANLGELSEGADGT